MKLKRILPLFLALVMVLSTVVAVPFGVSAEAATSTDATGADESTAGYKAENVVKITAESIAAEEAATVTMTEFAAGSQSAKYVSISSADEMVLFSDVSNGYNNAGYNFGGKVVYLTKDIDMNETDEEMYPIAFRTQQTNTYTNAMSFVGTFDGQGYTISNLNMTMQSLADVLQKIEARWGRNFTTGTNGTTANCINGWGLFCYLTGGAVVKNLRLDDTCHFETKSNGQPSGTGAIVGVLKDNGPRITNCYSAATVIDSATGFAGGFVGRADGQLIASNLTFEGSVTADCNVGLTFGSNAGGIVGFNCAGFDISNSVSNGVVTSKGRLAGGFVVGLETTGTITNSVNRSELIIDNANKNDDAVYMAGFVAAVRQSSTLTLTNVTNYSTDMHFSAGGGIVGRVFTDNFYNLDLTGTGWGSAISYKPTAAQVTLSCTNCKGVELDAGYSADRIKQLTGGTEITADTTDLGTATLFYISTPAGLQKLATLVNDNAVSFSGKTVYLTADLDMSGIDWMPIGARPNGNIANQASGIIFDGQGHVISNLICAPTYAESAAVGLFGVCSGGVIRNVVLDESCAFVSDGTMSNQSSGAILGYNGGTSISNCKSSAYVYGYYAGGITGGGLGGPVGAFFCTNNGTVQAYYRAAGIHGGFNGGSSSAMNCLNTGLICIEHITGATYNGTMAAAISNGATGGHQIRNNVNYGTVSAPLGYSCGMIVSDALDGTNSYHLEIRNNTNYGALSAATNTSNEFRDMALVATTSSVDNLLNNATIATVWGNKTGGNYVGYNARRIDRASADTMAKIADVKDVWTIANGAANLNTDYTEAPKVLKITDKAGMRVLSAVVYFGNSLKGTKIYLANDIDMTGMIYDATDLDFSEETTFLPIGHIDGSLWTADNQQPVPVPQFTYEGVLPAYDANNNKYFSGVFDGQGYAIKNWTVDNTTANSTLATRIGLFGLLHHGVVQNVVFDESNRMTNATASESRWTGVVVQATCSHIDNVWNRSDWTKDITAEIGGLTGGIAAFASISTITSCTNDGAVANGIGGGAGGIVGWDYNSVGIANCRNNGEVSSTVRNAEIPETLPIYSNLGGIIGWVGQSYGSATTKYPRIVNCVNNGAVTNCGSVTNGSTTCTPWTGSIVGYVHGAGQIRSLNNVDYANADLPLCGRGSNHNFTTAFRLFDLVEEDAMLDEMLHTRYQTKAVETTEEGDTVQDVRLIATVDAAANYQKAGFKLTNKTVGSEDYGLTSDAATTTAYSSLLAMAEGGEETCNPEKYGACTSQYFFAYVLDNVAAGDTFEAQSYVVTQDGTYLWGDVLTITIPAVAN